MAATRPAAWIGVPLSLAVGLAFYAATANTIEAESRQRFVGHAQTARNTIATRIKSYSDLMRGTAAMYRTNYPLTRAQFRSYVQGLDLEQHYSAVESINFAEYVRAEELEEFTRRMLSEPLADGSLPKSFDISPPGLREHYKVITLIEPAKHQIAIGRDMFGVPAHIQQTMGLRDSGKLGSSGIPIKWDLSGRNRTGMAVRLPIYRPNAPISTINERRKAYVGSIGVAFSIDLLVRGVIDEMPVKNARMTLVDHASRSNSAHSSVLFDSTLDRPEAPRTFSLFSDRFTHTLPIDFHGRQWDASFSVDAHEMYSGFEQFMPWVGMLGGFTGSMLLYALFHALTSSRRRAIKLAKGMTRELRESQAKLQLSHQNLRRLAAHADQIKEGERKRIAREIHDDLGQNLLALRIDADMLATRTRANHSRLHERARATLFHIDVTIKSVRQIINDLRPNVLDLGLSAAVEWQIAEFRRRTGIECELVDEPNEVVVNEQAATAFFRILQESLSNIVRHAQATSVRVVLGSTGRSLTMTVSDNGIGLGSGGCVKSGSFGLVGIEERINILGGTFSISSREGEGTTVSVAVPLGQIQEWSLSPSDKVHGALSELV